MDPRTRVQAARQDLEKKKGIFESLSEERSSIQSRIELLSDESRVKTGASSLLVKVCEELREEVSELFSQVSTRSVQAALGDGYKVSLTHEVKRGSPAVLIGLKSPDYEVETDPIDTRGGGVIDILSFAFRMAMARVKMSRGPLVLDEPFKHVSEDKIAASSEMLAGIARRLDRQIIVVTHKRGLAEAADNVIEVSP